MYTLMKTVRFYWPGKPNRKFNGGSITTVRFVLEALRMPTWLADYYKITETYNRKAPRQLESRKNYLLVFKPLAFARPICCPPEKVSTKLIHGVMDTLGLHSISPNNLCITTGGNNCLKEGEAL